MSKTRLIPALACALALLAGGCAQRPVDPDFAFKPGRPAAPEGNVCLAFTPELEHASAALTLRRALLARGMKLVGEVDAKGVAPKTCRIKVGLSGHWNASATAFTDAQLIYRDLVTGETRFARYREVVRETDNVFAAKYLRNPDDVVIDLVDRLFPEGL